MFLMELLIQVILIGMAVGYLTELVSSLLSSWVGTGTTKKALTLPLGALLGWWIGVEPHLLVLVAPGAGFLALVVLSLINRPVVLPGGNRRVI
jgi:hypothetical protein